jgi:hypothetical protein
MKKIETVHSEKKPGHENISKDSSLELLIHNALEEESECQSDLDRLQFLLRTWFYGRNALLQTCLESQLVVLENLRNKSFPLTGKNNPGTQERRPQHMKVWESSSSKEIKIPRDHQVKAE